MIVEPDDSILVTDIEPNVTSAQLEKGEQLQLVETVLPEDATNPAVTRKSSNTKIAKVDAKGKVTAVKAGTCTASDGSKVKANCKITVKAK